MTGLHNISTVEIAKALSASLEGLDVSRPANARTLYDVVVHLNEGMGSINERLDNARDYAPFMHMGFALSAVSFWALGQAGEATVTEQSAANDAPSRDLRVGASAFCAEITRFVFGAKNTQGAYLAVGDTANLLSNALDLAFRESKASSIKPEFLSCIKDASEALLGLAVEGRRCADSFPCNEEAAQ